MYLVWPWGFIRIKIFKDIFYFRNREMYLIRTVVINFDVVVTLTRELFIKEVIE